MYINNIYDLTSDYNKINLNLIPCRENNMTPYEIMLSESQERMLIVLKKGGKKWEIF